MPGFSVSDIEKQALEEIEREEYRAAVDAAKVRIRDWRARSLWQRIFPFRIVFIPLEKNRDV